MGDKKLRVFIAEDEPIVLMGFEALVKICGHEVVGTALDGQAAIDGIRKQQPDIVIMDIDMPVVDGITAADTVNQEQEIPTIIVTGYRNENYVERACAAGVFAYLQKPIDEYEMRSALKIAVSQFEKRRKAEQGQKTAESKLKERIIIERAKGVMMDQFGLTEQQAMKALQKKSADTNTKMAVVAHKIVDVSEKIK